MGDAATIDAVADYQRLQQWRFSAVPQQISANGITFTRDTARWTLQSGELRFIEPVLGGRVTGFVFTGTGRFEMSIPDAAELAQLRRFSGKSDLQKIEATFTNLLVRASDNVIPPQPADTFLANDLARKRHEQWLIDLSQDVDARVVTAALNGGALYLAAVMDTAEFGLVTYEYDSLRQEEIRLTRWNARHPEVWISLDRPEERSTRGRPNSLENSPVHLDHISVSADLTRYGRTGRVGQSHQRTFNGHYKVEETFTARADGISALRLEIAESAHDLAAVDENGTSLPVLRDHLGKRSVNINNDIWDNELAVILPTPLHKGEKRKITFEYDFETANYAPGGWYPMPFSESPQDDHTARVELIVPKRHEVRSMGKLENQTEDDKTKTTVWVLDQPTTMVTFSTADRFDEVKLDVKGIPQVVSFGPVFKIGNATRVRNVGADVANSLQYFESLLQDEVSGERFYVTNIAAGHGQAFEGFLHMSEYTYAAEHPGASELFRAHEVAHMWWGHKIGWKTYRDQWLSEAFAEYCAMMFVNDFVKGGKKYFEEILNSYEGIVKGNFAGGFSKFNRPWLIEFNSAYRNRLGPIGHGYRANTAEMPGYLIQTYHKGPLVIHMLRMILGHKTGTDDLFVKILRDFVDEYSGKEASTDDFRRIVERNTSGNWAPFFEAWIDRAEIPSYSWSYRVEPEGEALKLVLKIKRTGVDDNFVIPIPIRVEFPEKKSGVFFVISKEAEQTVVQKIPVRPTNVVFAPDHSLLANIRRE